MQSFGRACFVGALLAAFVGATLAAGSCTTFDGLVAKDLDAGSQADADADAGPPASGAYLSLENGARLCALAFECPTLPASITISGSIPIDPVNFSLCMTWVAGPIPPGRVGLDVQRDMLACVAAGPTCEAGGKCLSLERFDPGDPRCDTIDAGSGSGGAGGAGGGSTGTGSALDFCSADDTSVLHCGPSPVAIHCDVAYFGPGTSCLLGDNGEIWCSSGENCGISPSCSGSILEYCGGTTNLKFSINCLAIGNTCGVDPPSGSYDCLTDGTLRLCDTLSAVCAGDVVEVCDQDTTSLFKCAELGGTCNDDQGAAYCARADDECTPYDINVNVCDGTNIKLCVGGRRVSVDCASIDRTCTTVNGSVRCG